MSPPIIDADEAERQRLAELVRRTTEQRDEAQRHLAEVSGERDAALERIDMLTVEVTRMTGELDRAHEAAERDEAVIALHGALGRAVAALRDAPEVSISRSIAGEYHARAVPRSVADAILADPTNAAAGEAHAGLVAAMRERCASVVEWASLDWADGDPRKVIAAAIRALPVAAVDACKAGG